MKTLRMKGKNVEDAVTAAVQVLGTVRDKVKFSVISEGKSGVLGVIRVEEAEVEVVLSEGLEEDTKQVLQEILDKMSFVAMVEAKRGEESIELNIKGEDMGRIIGKEGVTLRSLEIIVSSVMGRVSGERVRVNIDADGYKEKRKKDLERLAKEVSEEVFQTGKEKAMPFMTPADRRLVHIYLQENLLVTTFSRGEGKNRVLIVAPRD